MGAFGIRTHLLILVLMFGSLIPTLSGCAEKDTPPADPVIHGSIESPAMCPWRDPTGDLDRFFPGVTDYTRDTLVLSPLRATIQQRLGAPPESNVLYAYRIKRGGRRVGTVLIRRASGEFGAIEIVVAISPDRRIVGVHLQRLREPPATQAALQNPKWLQAFQGKGPADDFTPGKAVPDVAPEARRSARAVADAVHALLVEYEIAETHNPSYK